VTLGTDTIPGGTAASIIIGTSGAETVDAGAGNDVVVAGAGNDSLLGNDGDDILSGGEGDDSVAGGTGADTLTGGAGADVLILSTAGHSGLTLATADRITDFATGSDGLRLGLAGTANNSSEAGAAVADFTAALTAANTALAALNAGTGNTDAQLYNFQFDATNGYLFIDRDSDGDADEVIVLVGITNTQITPSDIGGP
jgi:Ca2+-binding RTX toxin-like protein